MVSKSRTKQAEVKENKESDYNSRINTSTKDGDYAKSKVQKLRSSKAIVSGLSGGLVALLYTVGFFPPMVWGGTLIYVPALFAGLGFSLIYEGHNKNWKVGILAGLVSALPLIVAIAELYVNAGLETNLLSTVTLSIVSAVPLGLIGSYVGSKYLLDRGKDS
jgi:peptidoglycan/LPS O-acetylase OafA/YrhL